MTKQQAELMIRQALSGLNTSLAKHQELQQAVSILCPTLPAEAPTKKSDKADKNKSPKPEESKTSKNESSKPKLELKK